MASNNKHVSDPDLRDMLLARSRSITDELNYSTARVRVLTRSIVATNKKYSIKIPMPELSCNMYDSEKILILEAHYRLITSNPGVDYVVGDLPAPAHK